MDTNATAMAKLQDINTDLEVKIDFIAGSAVVRQVGVSRPVFTACLIRFYRPVPFVAVTQNAVAAAHDANDVKMEDLKRTTTETLQKREVCAVSTLCITIVFITCVCHAAGITGCDG